MLDNIEFLNFRPIVTCMNTPSIVASWPSSSFSACPRRGQHGHCRRPVGVEGEKKWTLDAATTTRKSCSLRILLCCA